MKSNHEAFYKKYFAVKNQERQLEMMKQYMLTLSPEEFDDFFRENTRALAKLIRENEWTASEREIIVRRLDESIAMLQKLKEGQVHIAA